jgi:hypothetical protein
MSTLSVLLLSSHSTKPQAVAVPPARLADSSWPWLTTQQASNSPHEALALAAVHDAVHFEPE